QRLGLPRLANHFLALLDTTLAGEGAAGVFGLEVAGHAVGDVRWPFDERKHLYQPIKRFDIPVDGAWPLAVNDHRLPKFVFCGFPRNLIRSGSNLFIMHTYKPVRFFNGAGFFRLSGRGTDVFAILASETNEPHIAVRFAEYRIPDTLQAAKRDIVSLPGPRHS